MAIDFAKDVRAYVSDYIKHSDAKAAALMTAVGLLGGAVWALAASTLKAAHDYPRTLALTFALLAVGVAGLCTAVLFCLGALIPRVPKAQGSLASFPDIAAKSQAAYVDEVSRLDEQTAAAEYALHAWTLSQVNLNKTKSLRHATMSVGAATLAALGVLIIHTCLGCLK